MIVLDGVAGRRAPFALAPVSLSWDAGVHAVVGAPADGGPLLLALVAGRARARAGVVRVLGEEPTAAGVRPQVAYVPMEPPLPDALRVEEALELAAELRGEKKTAPAAATRLATLGVEALAPRRVRTLAPDEARAVALAEALTSTRVRVVLVEEPLVGVDPRAAARLPETLRARAREGAAVLVATASARDAGALADDHVLLRGGAVVGRTGSLEALAGASPGGARVRVVCSDPRALVAALAREDDVEAIARRDGSVVARGRDGVALAQAAARAILDAGVDVSEMRLEPPSLEEGR